MLRALAVDLPIVAMADEQPSPRHLRPCCPMDPTNACQYRVPMIRSYLFARNLALVVREPWADVLADQLRGRAGEVALLVQSNRGHGSMTSRARDIVLSLERCRDELQIPLTFSNCGRLALALCRFSECG